MVLSSSQQAVVAFTAVLLTFVVFPRMFGGGGGLKEARPHDPRFSRKGPGPGAVQGQPFNIKNAASLPREGVDNVQQMRKMLEQEMKSEKYKSNNKGYVFTLMPLYAIGVGLFAAYKFLKIKSADETQAQKDVLLKGAKKSKETESQLNELEQRLAQTEKMLNSILTQLDPLTNCVKSVAMEQKNEIMSQLQCIRQLMKKRGMDCPPMNIEEPSCQRNLDKLIESLAAQEMVPETSTLGQPEEDAAAVCQQPPDLMDPEVEMEMELEMDEVGDEKGEGLTTDDDQSLPSLQDSGDVLIGNITSAEGLRRRNRPE
ncbi:coiled-coil domain-containing protein 107 [Denticeps clupeoides]|uniref:Resistance to inhibitors of cholinesterase protein 3 N-terminal domain-containing protein n=1 Tax=Denticeps clupeoides TaxID=299321 RepID=A0AAY4EY09_9TELE|nr:coiled-coil domain-containing protein 107 [Denticeps clupeoides]